MNKAWIVTFVLSLLPLAASAAPKAEVLKQVESSMLVKGTIDIDTDGGVSSLAIDQADKFPGGLVGFVQKQVKEFNRKLSSPLPEDELDATVLVSVAKKYSSLLE